MTDREKLIALLKVDHCPGYGIEDCYECVYSECDDCYTARTADALLANGVVVREKGKWVLTDARFAEMSCSLCGFTYYGVHDYECMSGFCPDCGCDMRKEENDGKYLL